MLTRSQVPHAVLVGACELFVALHETVASPNLTSPSQGRLAGYNQQGHRAPIAAVFKNVLARARPACHSATLRLTSQTGFEVVLEGRADRYPRRGQHDPQGIALWRG